jgi:hypothetical protein
VAVHTRFGPDSIDIVLFGSPVPDNTGTPGAVYPSITRGRIAGAAVSIEKDPGIADVFRTPGEFDIVFVGTLYAITPEKPAGIRISI